MELGHGGLHSFYVQGVDGLKGVLHGAGDGYFLARGGFGQYIRSNAVPVAGVPYSQAQALEVRAAVADHVAQAVVAAVAAAGLQPRRAGRQVEVVVDDERGGGRPALK